MATVTLARRLSAVVMISLLIIWLIMVIASYIGNDWEEESFRPSPERLAAIADAIENTDPQRRPALIAALSAPILAIEIVPQSDTSSTGQPKRATSEEIAKRYASAFADRAFTVSRYAVPASRNDIVQLTWRRRTVLEFRIGLRSGETLVITNQSPVIATPLGLPVGLGAGLLGSISALIALLTLYREIRPLTELARAVDRIDLDGAMIPLPDISRQSTEIKALATAFNRLQGRLVQLMRARMALVAGLSHDVRTFATRLRLRVDAIPDDRKRERAVQDIADMIQLLDDALLAARVGIADLQEELVDLVAFIRNEIDDRRSAGLHADFRADVADGRAMVLGDVLAIRRMIANLVENAIKYGGAARVSVQVDGRWVVITVEDDGPGMPEELADLLTEPFVRGETSRNRETGGAGLGLAIVKKLAEAHGGRIAIGKSPAGSTRISIFLPRYNL